MDSEATLRELAGDTLLVGVPGEVLDAQVGSRLEALRPAGVTLFAGNIVQEASVRTLVASLGSAIDQPLIAVDQEGGRVDRLRAIFGPAPTARTAGAAGTDAVRSLAVETARRLRRLGLNVNFAPVADIDEGNDANGLGDRCFGTEPDAVAWAARAVVEAHVAEGVLPCLKHFPGLGRTRGDTHVVRPAVEASGAELREREMVPYRLLDDRGQAVMVGHAAYPTLTGHGGPASLSPPIVGNLLRRELGFDGLVFTDDLEMGAVAEWSPGERAVRAIDAGCDVLLFCHRLDEAEDARNALVGAVRSGRLAVERLTEASRRCRAVRRALSAAALHRDRLAPSPGSVSE